MIEKLKSENGDFMVISLGAVARMVANLFTKVNELVDAVNNGSETSEAMSIRQHNLSERLDAQCKWISTLQFRLDSLKSTSKPKPEPEPTISPRESPAIDPTYHRCIHFDVCSLLPSPGKCYRNKFCSDYIASGFVRSFR